MSVSEWSGRPDEPERAETVPSVAAPGPTPVPADTEERDGREPLSGDHSGSPTRAAVEALAALLEPEAFDPTVSASRAWREPTQAVALNHAAKVITSGYRLVSEDDATLDRVAAAIFQRLPPLVHMGRRRRRDGT